MFTKGKTSIESSVRYVIDFMYEILRVEFTSVYPSKKKKNK